MENRKSILYFTVFAGLITHFNNVCAQIGPAANIPIQTVGPTLDESTAWVEKTVNFSGAVPQRDPLSIRVKFDGCEISYKYVSFPNGQSRAPYVYLAYSNVKMELLNPRSSGISYNDHGFLDLVQNAPRYSVIVDNERHTSDRLNIYVLTKNGELERNLTQRVVNALAHIADLCLKKGAMQRDLDRQKAKEPF